MRALVAAVFILSLAGPLTAQAAWTHERSIGAIEGPLENIFGKVLDIAAQQNGRFVVLDERLQEIRLFDPSGRLLARAGGPGRGPSEFFVPESVDIDGNGVISVLDRGNGWLSEFAIRGDSIAHVGTLRLAIQAFKHCSIEGRYFMLARHDGRMIHEVDIEGRVVRSFGQVQRVDLGEPFKATVERWFNDGPLECLASSRRIAWMPSNTGTVFIFDLEGNEVERLPVPGFMKLNAVMTARGTQTYEPEHRSRTWTVGTHLQELGDAAFLVQMDSMWVAAKVGQAKRISVLLHRDGTTERLDLPEVGDVQGTRVWGWSNDPYPQVHIGSLRQGG